MRIPQPEGVRGSLKWIQKLVASGETDWLPEHLKDVDWASPLPDDDWAEYRDSSFLDCVGQSALTEQLRDFWPARGPQWDALGRLNGVPVLVEAKAHVREFFSPATQASSTSRQKILRAFCQAAPDFGSDTPERWANLYFQYANRLAHLWFFHHHGIQAHLLFVSFLDDADMNGPSLSETWHASFTAADYALGIRRNALSKNYLSHAMPSVTDIK